jgi:hypothetical protein
MGRWSTASRLFKDIPPASDHSWLKNTRELLEFLVKPRSWRDLDTWNRLGETYLRHAMAWLEEHGEARTFTRDEKIYWVRVGASWPADKVEQDGRHSEVARDDDLDPVILKPPHLPTIPPLESSDDLGFEEFPTPEVDDPVTGGI